MQDSHRRGQYGAADRKPTHHQFVEGKSEDDLNNILNKLGYSMKDTVSCTADDIYRKYGKSMFDNRELKF